MAKKRVAKKNPKAIKRRFPLKTMLGAMLIFLTLFNTMVIVDQIWDIDLRNGASVFNGNLKGGETNVQINPLDVTFSQGNKGAMSGQMVPIEMTVSNGFSTKMVKTRLTLIVEDKVIDSVEIPNSQDTFIGPGQSIPIIAQFEMPKTSDTYVGVVIREEVRVYEGDGSYIGTYTKDHFTNVQYLGECSYPCIPTLETNPLASLEGFKIPDLTKYGFPKELQETLNRTVYGIPIWILGLIGIGLVFVVPNLKTQKDPRDDIALRDLNDRRVNRKIDQLTQIIKEDTESQLYIDDRIERTNNWKDLKEIVILGALAAGVLIAIFIATKYGMLPK
ncbi:MAG: hypothetical protein AMQ74_01726 [Candidatus Methanofastidiosum methylothiophilum]|uniref:Uncharacterized protein n=1 Tax=Candidatus Methanofastidiosum methylothiophilum TaxID=1705564 RepID=A0A150IQ93_9EURY|nr:MAG: hypothetical protein AMQ74_01726 [Candidatus Methanofastidiosum methylthiophilus]